MSWLSIVTAMLVLLGTVAICAGHHHGNRDKPMCQRGLHDMKVNAHVRKNGSRYCRPCANERERARRKVTA